MCLCLVVVCSHPGNILNGQREGNGPFVCGLIVPYTCNPGFILAGRPNISCLINGVWDSVAPSCIETGYPHIYTYLLLFITMFKTHTSFSNYMKIQKVGVTCYYSSASSGQVGYQRNMKSMWLTSVTIFFMTYIYRAVGAMVPRVCYCTNNTPVQIQLNRIYSPRG